jgi:hypothetical protein
LSSVQAVAVDPMCSRFQFCATGAPNGVVESTCQLQ